MKRFLCGALCATLFLAAGFAAADVKLPAVFSDNMVVQRDSDVAVWGWAAPGENVTVQGNWDGAQPAAVAATPEGKWSVKIKTPKAGGPYTITVTAANVLTLHNVLSGEVWVCSGQSNMEMPMKGYGAGAVVNWDQELAESNIPEIRMFTVKKCVADAPKDDCEGVWAVCAPETMPDFSATGFSFAKALYKALGVPVGMLHTSWGGTPAEAWTTREKLAADPDLKPIMDRYDAAKAAYPQALADFNLAVGAWEEAVKKAKADGTPEPERPKAPADPLGPGTGGSLYNGMIAPIVPYGIRGAIWYQGESNRDRAYQYRKLFPTMIQCWRESWGLGPFPFEFVQIAPFNYREDAGNPATAELREAQMMTQSLENTGMAVTMDVGELPDIHPHNKQEVGRRLALNALAKTYGRAIEYSGPVYTTMAVEGDAIRLTFSHADGGLATSDGQAPTCFTIAGEDKNFVPATAVIDGSSVVVRGDGVAAPVAVRYGWKDIDQPNLCNKTGLPSSSFRTDDWPGVTINNR